MHIFLHALAVSPLSARITWVHEPLLLLCPLLLLGGAGGVASGFKSHAQGEAAAKLFIIKSPSRTSTQVRGTLAV